MADETQRFLDAEEQASRLVDELSKLRDEAASHAASAEALTQSSDALSDIASRVGGLVDELGGMIRTARELGIPGLLEEHETEYRDRLANGIREVTEHVGNTEKSLASRMEGSTETMAHAIKEAQSANLGRLDQLGSEVASASSGLRKHIVEGNENLEVSTREASARLEERLADLYKRQATFSILLGVALLVVIGLLVWPLVSAG